MDWKKHTEAFILLFCIIAVGVQVINLSYAPALLAISFGLMGFYYIFSAFLVLYNRKLLRSIRFIYFAGLWATTICTIGVCTKLCFIPNSNTFLVIGTSVAAASLLLIFLQFLTTEKEKSKSIRYAMQPVFVRVAAAGIVALTLYLVPYRNLYHSIGRFRMEAHYIDLLDNALQDPTDLEKFDTLKAYEKVIIRKNLPKIDSTASPKRSR